MKKPGSVKFMDSKGNKSGEQTYFEGSLVGVDVAIRGDKLEVVVITNPNLIFNTDKITSKLFKFNLPPVEAPLPVKEEKVEEENIYNSVEKLSGLFTRLPQDQYENVAIALLKTELDLDTEEEATEMFERLMNKYDDIVEFVTKDETTGVFTDKTDTTIYDEMLKKLAEAKSLAEQAVSSTKDNEESPSEEIVEDREETLEQLQVQAARMLGNIKTNIRFLGDRNARIDKDNVADFVKIIDYMEVSSNEDLVKAFISFHTNITNTNDLDEIFNEFMWNDEVTSLLNPDVTDVYLEPDDSTSAEYNPVKSSIKIKPEGIYTQNEEDISSENNNLDKDNSINISYDKEQSLIIKLNKLSLNDINKTLDIISNESSDKLDMVVISRLTGIKDSETLEMIKSNPLKNYIISAFLLQK